MVVKQKEVTAAKQEGATRSLIEFVAKTKFEDLPAEVVHKTKQLLLDTIGSALGGSTTDLGGICLNVVKELGGKDESTIVGSGYKTSCTNAAWVNGKFGNALDSDDCVYNGSHFVSPAVAAALALGEHLKASGKDVLNAITVGYDCAARVGVSRVKPGPAAGFQWHTIGAIIVSSKLLGLNEHQMLNALGIGCENAPVCGCRGFPRTMVKYGDMGWMAFNGILAAMLAKQGHTATTDVLEGERSFFISAGAEGCDYDRLLGELGKKWYVMESSIKTYPTCRWMQASLDMFTKMVNENNLKPEDIEKVVVRVHSMAVRSLSIYEPKGYNEAQTSFPYCISLVAHGVPPSPEWQSPKLYKDPEILSFHRKVKVEEHPDAAKIIASPGQSPYGFKRSPSSVEVTAKGKVLTDTSEYARGDPWFPETRMTDDEVKDKFRAYAIRVAQSSLRWRERIEGMIEKVYNIEKVGNITELMELSYP